MMFCDVAGYIWGVVVNVLQCDRAFVTLQRSEGLLVPRKGRRHDFQRA